LEPATPAPRGDWNVLAISAPYLFKFQHVSPWLPWNSSMRVPTAALRNSGSFRYGQSRMHAVGVAEGRSIMISLRISEIFGW